MRKQNLFAIYFFVLFSILGLITASETNTKPPITCLVFSPDGKTVVAGSQTGLIIYSYPELILQKQIKVSAANIHDLAYSPDGNLLAVGGGNPAESGIVELFSMPEGKQFQKFSAHTDSVMTVAWLDDTTLASGSLDHIILFWDIQSGKQIQQFLGHSRGVSSLCFLNDKKTMVSTGIDQSVRVWNLPSGELLRSLNHHTQVIHALALNPVVNGLPIAASAGGDRTVRFWQPTIGRMVRFARLDSEPLDIVWINNGEQIAASCKDGHIRIIDPVLVTVTKDISAINGLAYALAVHPIDGGIVVGGSNGHVRRYVN